jgi:hypothetical protein
VGMMWNTGIISLKDFAPARRVRIEASADRHYHLTYSSIRQDAFLTIQAIFAWKMIAMT